MITHRKRTNRMNGSPGQSLSAPEPPNVLSPRTSAMLRVMNKQRRASHMELMKMRLSSSTSKPAVDQSESLRYSVDTLKYSLSPNVDSLRYSLDSFDLEILEEDEQYDDESGGEGQDCRRAIVHQMRLDSLRKRSSLRFSIDSLGIFEEDEIENGNENGPNANEEEEQHRFDRCGAEDKSSAQQSDEEKAPRNDTSAGVLCGYVEAKDQDTEANQPISVSSSELNSLEETDNEDEENADDIPLGVQIESPCTSMKKALNSYLESLDFAVEEILSWEKRKSEIRREMDGLNNATE